MTYQEIIALQRSKLHPSIAWWPVCFYHFTNINNAIGLIDQEWIYGRVTAQEKNLMKSDNASPGVIKVTSDFVKDYGRLYFRPLTPTQYYNEGYKPAHVRNEDINANCPVPIFFCLDAERTLSLDGVGFVECGLAGQHHQEILYGETAFSQLNFSKIFHNGSFPSGSDITQYRHSEIVRGGGIPIGGLVRKIFCRSLAEQQTLIYLLGKQLPHKYDYYIKKIEYNPNLAFFYNNGIFIKTVKKTDEGVRFLFNDNRRYRAEKSNGQDVLMTINIYWLEPQNATIIEKEEVSAYLDYEKSTGVDLVLRRRQSDRVILEVKFDNHLMFRNDIWLQDEILF